MVRARRGGRAWSDGDRRGRWVRATAVVGGAYVISTSIKLAIGRKRPLVEDLPHLMATPTGLSFPSLALELVVRRRARLRDAAAARPAVRRRRRDGALPALPRRPLPLRHRRRRGARHRLGHTGTVMKVGIVGLPNAGKSSLFNALSRAGAEAANYPFTTIEPNVAVVPVADERLDAVAKTIGASNIVPDTIEFHDIAGLVRGAHEGEGLGNKFLANIRETDALLHVVRCHGDENVIHPDGRVSTRRRTSRRSRPS